MPLEDTPWERGKCGYKLIQYMALGLPVVASAVGVNKHIVRHGENGFLAANPGEWRDALARLGMDPALRRSSALPEEPTLKIATRFRCRLRVSPRRSRPP